MSRPEPARRLVAAVLTLMAIATAGGTGIGLWLSYEALHTYAGAHRLTGPQAWAWPAAVDLFVVVGELGWFVSVVSRRPDWYARALVLVGFAASLGFNVAHAGADAADRAVAAVPPCAALLALAALMRQVYRHADRRAGTGGTQAGTEAGPGGTEAGASRLTVPPEPVAVPPVEPAVEQLVGDVDELARRVVRDAAAAGEPLSERQLAARFGRSRTWAKRVTREAAAGERVITFAR